MLYKVPSDLVGVVINPVLALLATSSFGYLCIVWLLWLNVGRDLVNI